MDIEDADIDWKGILKNPMLDVRNNYVLILEWLPEFDAQGLLERRSGEATARWLSQKYGENKVDFHHCKSSDDVRRHLRDATDQVRSRGVPIVQIDAHGGVDGFMGPDGEGGMELLDWRELGIFLRALNVATRFNLMLIGAACFGEGLLLADEPGEPKPFVAVAGYMDTVSPASLQDSMVELYRQLFDSRNELGESVEEADRQHRYETDAVLRSTSTIILTLQAFIDEGAERFSALATEGGVSKETQRAALVDSALKSLPMATARKMLRRILRTSIEQAWPLLWMTREFPENAQRFAIDFERVIDAAEAVAAQRAGMARE